MNILILDKDELTWQGIDHFKEFRKEWHFFNYSSIEKGKFTFADFDLLIVDISDCKNEMIYKEILNLDNTKRIIVLSETLERCHSNDCSYCQKNNKMRRLMKPMELNKLYYLINSFDQECDFFDAFENISNLIESVVKRYSSLNYDSKTKEVQLNMRSPSSLYTQELLAFINILEQNKVTYRIIDETKIQIK